MGKKNRKQQSEPDWLEDAEEEMESMRAEMGIGPKKTVEAKPVAKKKEKTRKPADDDESEEEDAPAMKKATAFAALMVDDDDSDGGSDDQQDEDDEPEPQPAKQAANGKAAAKKPVDQSDDDELDEEDGQQTTVKTAAQKKAERKEREKAKKEKERQKKAAQKAKAKAKKEAERKELDELDDLLQSSSTDPAAKEGAKKEEAAPAKKEPEVKAESKPKPAAEPEKKKTQEPEPKAEPETPESPEKHDDDEGGSDEEGDDDGKKKKKKKKKKGAADKEKPGPKVSKAKAALLHKLQEQQELEERIKREEEERKRLEEEARIREEEEARLAEEARLRKKEKEKEKKERLRAEGKLLTAKQKQQKQMAEQKLAQMRAMGIEIPATAAEGGPKKPVRYDNKKKKKGQQPKTPTSTEPAESLPEVKSEEPEKAAEPEETPTTPEAEDEAQAATAEPESAAAAPEPEPEPEPEKPAKIKSSWDESTDEEADDDEDEAKPASKKKTAEKAEKAAAASAEAAKPAEKPVDPTAKKQAEKRIASRRDEAEKMRSAERLRSPIVAVLGHVDTGKTKLLDKIRRGNVQEGEAGGITQQIGATYFPKDEIEKSTKSVTKASSLSVDIPGLLIIDTPGHESFSNLRSRGSSLCDIAILVVDIMHGLEPQTLESIELLRSKKTPFIVALNKVDRCNEWIASKGIAIQNALKKQKPHTISDFETRSDQVKVQLAQRSINAELYWKNPDERSFVNIVPTSAHTGEGIPDLLFLLVSLTQRRLAHRIAFSEELEATVLEVKVVPGLGTTIDVILAQGSLKEGSTIVLCGLEGPIVTTVRSLLMPQPLKELRVKNAYQHFKEVVAANGVKIAADGLGKAVAGTPLLVASSPDEIDVLKEEQERRLEETLNAIKTEEKGVSVQASTLGSLEALMEFLKQMKIPVATINIGPIHKRDITKASIQLEKDRKYAVILAFDVTTDREAQQMADDLGIRIFTADIIYHLFDAFTKYLEDLKAEMREKYKNIATFPCKIRILPNCLFNARDPIVMGVRVEEGILKSGTPLCVASKNDVVLGVVSSLEFDHKEVETARKGQEVCIKIEAVGGEKKMFGRHFEMEDVIISKISRESIDACKEYFRDDLSKEEWKLMVQLKKHFNIL